VHSEICGTQATLDAMRAAGLAADVAACHRGPLGPLMRQRLQHLRALGAVGTGQDDEEVVVIAGTARATAAEPSRRQGLRLGGARRYFAT
jgi:release factor glutamine methyltransferase